MCSHVPNKGEQMVQYQWGGQGDIETGMWWFYSETFQYGATFKKHKVGFGSEIILNGTSKSSDHVYILFYLTNPLFLMLLLLCGFLLSSTFFWTALFLKIYPNVIFCNSLAEMLPLWEWDSVYLVKVQGTPPNVQCWSKHNLSLWRTWKISKSLPDL